MIKSLLVCLIISVLYNSEIYAQQPGIGFSDTSIVFEDIIIGETAIDSILIYNLGDTLLHINNIMSDNNEYTPSFADTSVLPGDTVALMIQFAPQQRGITNGIINLETNDAANNEIFIQLSGTAIAPEIFVSAKTVDFGVVNITDSAAVNVTVTNNGELNLTLSKFRFADSTLNPFHVNLTDTVVYPNSSIQLHLTYNYRPQIKNVLSNVLSFNCSDPLNNNIKIYLKAISYRKVFIPDDFNTIQSAIDSSWHGDTLIVRSGVYTENINLNGKNIFLSSQYYSSRDTSDIINTIIDGNEQTTVITINSNEDSSCIISGFTITGGHEFCGGGFYLENSSPVLKNLNIRDNWSVEGGGIWGRKTNPQLYALNVRDNYGGGNGGGFYFDSSNVNFKDIKIYSNRVGTGGGGGINLINSNSIMVNIQLSANSAWGGAALMFTRSNSTLINMEITGNYTNSWAAGIFCEDSEINLIHVTLANNYANHKGGLYFYGKSRATIINSIIWNNLPYEMDLTDATEGAISVAYSDIKEGMGKILYNSEEQLNWLDGNISVFPQFVDSANGDFRLSDSSKCIGRAIPALQIDQTLYSAPVFDLDYNMRPNPLNSNPDLGAYENPRSMPLSPKIAIYETSLAFDSVSVNETDTLALLVYNKGELDLDFKMSTNAPFFTTVDSAELAAGDSLSIALIFMPESSGTFSDTLKIESNDPDIPLLNVRLQGVAVVVNDIAVVINQPLHYQLQSNYPNPFNAQTTIEFTLERSEFAELVIYDQIGKKVTTVISDMLKAAKYKVHYDAKYLASGIYYYVLQTKNFRSVKKMLLIK